jgi:hypothetical protein
MILSSSTSLDSYSALAMHRFPGMAEHKRRNRTPILIHKMRIALKKLWLSPRWLKWGSRSEIQVAPDLHSTLLDEADQLIRIFITSIRTAPKNPKKPSANLRSKFKVPTP